MHLFYINILIFKFFMSSICFETEVDLQENGCICKYVMIRFTCIGISIVYNTYRYTCIYIYIYTLLPEDEPGVRNM